MDQQPDKHSYDLAPIYNSPPPPPPPPRPLDRDTLCFKCGYNLRSLLPDSLCPQCGSPVSQSLVGNHLAASDPDWVNALRTAILLRLGGIILTLTTLVAAVYAYIHFKHVVSHVTDFLNLIHAGLSMASVWLLTTQEPRVSLVEGAATKRNALRIFTLVGIAGSIAQIMAGYMPDAVQPLKIAGWSLTFLGLPAFWLFYLYLSDLALRIPHPQLAIHSRIIMWGYTLSYAIIMLTVGAAIATKIPLLACLALPAIIALLVFAVWSAVLYVRFYNVFTFCARQARTRAAPIPENRSIYQ